MTINPNDLERPKSSNHRFDFVAFSMKQSITRFRNFLGYHGGLVLQSIQMGIGNEPLDNYENIRVPATPSKPSSNPA